MPDKELIIAIAKELLLKALENPKFPVDMRAKEAGGDLGDQFKTLVAKVSEALSCIPVSQG